MKNKLTKILLVSSLLASGMSFAADEGRFGLNEEATVNARKTLTSVRKIVDEAVRIVEGIIYPNLATYNVDTSAGTGILVDLVGSTATKTPTLASSLSGQFTSYTSNPYLARAAILESGLKVQMQFVDSGTGVSNANAGATFNVPIFESFYGKKIILIPIFNVKYSSGKLTIKDQEINTWECLTDADEGISTSGTTIAAGMRSVVSMGGGILGTCQYLPSTSFSTVWQTI
ncbi:hypothetical protein [Candidatus Phycorickettsia trachydisci]|nr:hypothetical protein [Candidatus Phycorickettsia trachydisci]